MLTMSDVAILLDAVLEHQCLLKPRWNFERMLLISKLIAYIPSSDDRDKYCKKVERIFEFDQYTSPHFENLVDALRKMILAKARLEMEETIHE